MAAPARCARCRSDDSAGGLAASGAPVSSVPVPAPCTGAHSGGVRARVPARSYALTAIARGATCHARTALGFAIEGDRDGDDGDDAAAGGIRRRRDGRSLDCEARSESRARRPARRGGDRQGEHRGPLSDRGSARRSARQGGRGGPGRCCALPDRRGRASAGGSETGSAALLQTASVSASPIGRWQWPSPRQSGGEERRPGAWHRPREGLRFRSRGPHHQGRRAQLSRPGRGWRRVQRSRQSGRVGRQPHATDRRPERPPSRRP